MIAGSDIENGCASSLTERLSRSPSRASSARRVGSDKRGKGAVQDFFLILNHMV